MLAAVCLAGLVLATPSGAALEVRLFVTPATPWALEPAEITLRTYVPLRRADGSCCRLVSGGPSSYPFRVEVVSPTGKVSRVALSRSRANQWNGVFRFPRPGHWRLRVANYDQSYRHAPGARPRISIVVRPARPTLPPDGFGALGKPGCRPPSPANRSVEGFKDIFGTAVGRELWALPFLPKGAAWSTPDKAVFDRLVGKEVKIVFAMTSWQPGLEAVGQDGSVVAPVWGPSGQVGSSSWGRPGIEWGAGFVFPAPGCWQIRVGRASDLWLLLRS